MTATATAAETRLEYIRWFDEIGIDDVALVGGKNAAGQDESKVDC